MPRTPHQALVFLASLWVSLTLMGPLAAPWAWAEDPETARLEADLFRQVNQFRREQRLISLERRADLDAVARAHCADMIERGFFSHDNPDGENWVDRMRRAGVTGFTLAGENLAQTSRAEPNRETLTGWLHSPDHRRNLVARPYNSTGLGVVRAPDGRLFYAQLYVTFPR